MAKSWILLPHIDWPSSNNFLMPKIHYSLQQLHMTMLSGRPCWKNVEINVGMWVQSEYLLCPFLLARNELFVHGHGHNISLDCNLLCKADKMIPEPNEWSPNIIQDIDCIPDSQSSAFYRFLKYNWSHLIIEILSQVSTWSSDYNYPPSPQLYACVCVCVWVAKWKEEAFNIFRRS